MMRFGWRVEPPQIVINAQTDEANEDHTCDKVKDHPVNGVNPVKGATPGPHPKCLSPRGPKASVSQHSQA
jgi:hypothetical protein